MRSERRGFLGPVGVLTVDVTVNDGNGGSATDIFQITVSNANDAPTVAHAIPNRNAATGTAFSYTRPPTPLQTWMWGTHRAAQPSSLEAVRFLRG